MTGTLEEELADAVYYLQHGCEPCAERHFHLARRLGASEEQLSSAIRLGRRGEATQPEPPETDALPGTVGPPETAVAP